MATPLSALRGPLGTLSAYTQLSKARLSALVVVTSGMGYCAASPGALLLELSNMTLTAQGLGVGVAAAGASPIATLLAVTGGPRSLRVLQPRGIKYTKKTRMLLCVDAGGLLQLWPFRRALCGLWRSHRRRRDCSFGGRNQSSRHSARRGQYRPLFANIHANEAAQRRQHLGRRRCWRSASSYGICCCNRPSLRTRALANGRHAVFLAVSSLFLARVVAPKRLCSGLPQDGSLRRSNGQMDGCYHDAPHGRLEPYSCGVVRSRRWSSMALVDATVLNAFLALKTPILPKCV